MKASLLGVLVLITAIAVAQSQNHPLIEADAPFNSSGVIRLSDDGKIEEGAINGVRYEIHYANGAGFFKGKRGISVGGMQEDWTVHCHKDAMDDSKFCIMMFHDLSVAIDDKGNPTVFIGNEHYPGSNAAIRIDKGTAISTPQPREGYATATSARIVQMLSKATTVTTRYERWPNQWPVDDTWDVYGFNEALAYIRWAIARIK